MHAPIEKCIRNLIELPVKRHLGDQRKVSSIVVPQQACLTKQVGAVKAVVQVSQTQILLDAFPTLAGPLIHEMEPFFKLSCDLAFSIDEFGLWISYKYGGVVVHNLDRTLKQIRTHKIVGRGPTKI